MENEKLHSGHWKRFREKVLKMDTSLLTDKEMLELTLQYIFTRGDLNDLSSRLIKKFGSFANVLNSNISDLVEVEGISETSAQKIILLPKIINFYNISNAKMEDQTLNCKELCINLAKKFLFGLKFERLYMFCISSNGKLKKEIVLGEGFDSCNNLNIGSILSRATENHSKYVFLAHNHPDGKIFPSDIDIDFTQKFAQILYLSGIKLIDHIIVHNNDKHFSFDDKGLIEEFLKKYN